VEVFIDSNGQLGTRTSSRRFKKDIHDMGNVTDRLMRLRPVTFRYKKAAADGARPLQYGLIAEEVAKVYPDLVQYDKSGKPFTIYYHLLTPMLLNELQKVYRQNGCLTSHVASLQRSQMAEIAALKSEVGVLKSHLASVEQSQQRKVASLQQSVAKLTALMEARRSPAAPQDAAFVQHQTARARWARRDAMSLSPLARPTSKL
jgi:hypothetical protein